MNDIFTQISRLKDSSLLDDEHYYNIIHEKVSYLLNHEINLLFQLLYRIDIPEHQVKQVFHAHRAQDDISKELTLLIIKRLKEKIALRQKYS